MVKSPAHYRWSSYRANAQAKPDELVTPHALYSALAKNADACAESYRAMFKDVVEDTELNNIRAAWQTGTPLGSDKFKIKIENKLGCKVGQARRGRPPKTQETDDV
jgi:putative transposase